MGFLFKEAKSFYGITAVILLLLLVFTNTACSSELEPAFSAPFSTPNRPTKLPPTATAVIIPATPTNSVLNNAEQVLFSPGFTATTLQHDLAANESYTYMLYGIAGRLLAVDIAASNNDMVFTILDGMNQALATSQGNQPIRVTLPEDGNYFINIKTPNENGRQYGCSMALSLTKGNTVNSVTTGGIPTAIPPTFAPLPTQLSPTDVPQIIAETAVIQQAEPIIFAPGETITTKSGQVNNGTEKTYSIRGSEGQELIIFANAGQPGIVVSVTGLNIPPFPEFRSSEIFDEILPTTQDYLIKVSPQASTTNLDYSLTLSLATPELRPSQESIIFKPNAEPVTINGILFPDSAKTYLFNATEGQTLTIDTALNNSNFTISIHDENNILLGWTTSGIPISAFLPTSQNYFITLMPSTDTQDLNYTMTVTVQ